MNLRKFKILDGSMLKLVAVITMLIDHTTLILLSDTEFATEPFLSLAGKELTLCFILRKIGRLAFPLFCFLITEGFIHTKNLKKYILNLAFFAIVSEIPFDLMVSGKFIYLGSQNIYFTLILGVFALWVIKNVENDLKRLIFLALIITAAIVFRVDYGYAGIALIMLIYVLRNYPVIQTALALPMLSGGYAALCAFVPINMYNGKRGFIKGKFLKYFFYTFYPLHIICLLLIKHLF